MNAVSGKERVESVRHEYGDHHAFVIASENFAVDDHEATRIGPTMQYDPWTKVPIDGRKDRWPASIVVAVACIAVAVAGCAPGHRGAFESAGYTSKYGYLIPYEQGTQRLLPADWVLENFERWNDSWEPKWSGKYQAKYKLDSDVDGQPATTIVGYKYALRYEHRVHAGVIWLRDIPIETKLRRKELHVLMQSYIDELAGAVYETVQGDSTSPWAPRSRIVVEHRSAPVVVEEGPAIVAGWPAYTATIDIANIDEVHVAPQTRTLRIQIVLLRVPHDELYEPIRDSGPARRYPVVMVAGYSNMPADFARGLDDFHGLLQRIAIEGKTGFALAATQHPMPPPPPRAPAAP